MVHFSDFQLGAILQWSVPTTNGQVDRYGIVTNVYNLESLPPVYKVVIQNVDDETRRTISSKNLQSEWPEFNVINKDELILKLNSDIAVLDIEKQRLLQIINLLT